MEPEINESRSKRKKLDKTGRFAALEKLKKLKGSKHKCEISGVENVFETVDEKEYVKEVLNRQDDDWIVDDDGSGYIEDGRDIFDDDLDTQSIAAASSKNKKATKKKKAVSENAGKGNLQFMLSNMSGKKKETVNLEDDDILSELIQEIEEDKSEMENSASISSEEIERNSIFNEKQEAKNYMRTFSAPKPPKPIITPGKMRKPLFQKAKTPIFKPENVLKEIKQNETTNEVPKVSVKPAEEETPLTLSIEKAQEKTPDLRVPSPESSESDMFDDDIDMAQIEDYVDPEGTAEAKDGITEEQLLNGWNTMQLGSCNDDIEAGVNVDSGDLSVIGSDGQQVFRFFWWDAFEDRRAQPGAVFLFGKTYSDSTKTYVSCCVAVRNIERKIFLLPRTNFKTDNSKPVTLLDVYHEFNNNVATTMQLDAFKSRKVTKNYAFDPSVPTESEYLEVRYSAKSPPISSENCSGETYSRVFGINTNYLEIFLLERKIKGPCWLDVTNAETATNPLSWCKIEINCLKSGNISVANSSKSVAPPPLVVATVNMRTIVSNDSKFGVKNEIVMITCLVQTKYAVDKQPPSPPFQQHFCVFARPCNRMLPLNMHEALSKYKATRVQKMDNEKGLLNYFISQFAAIDPDLVVGHDLQGYQLDLLCHRLRQCGIRTFSKLSRIKRNELPYKGRFEREVLCGRLVCDIKTCAKELIKSRSFDLDTLCQTVLKMKEEQRINLEAEEIPKMYQNSSELLKLVTITMQDTAYILKMMYELNVIPLALQITNIAGNVMSRTLMGGRSERNEFLLLHAFTEKEYIAPDKEFGKQNKNEDENVTSTSKRKKPTYSGGLVLEPKVGFYDKFILLMDFNSLYPSIIQEYNVCFTTFSFNSSTDAVIPDKNVPPGILPTEIRKLVESRREVKKLMKNVDTSSDLYVQYHIRQMALKLTANSMYGCLGFSNSRFFAKELAAFITQKGREILMSTKDLVEKLSFDVIYGDTDSIMINTNCLDYDQVMTIGKKIKQDVNKLYHQVELDIDGVFKYLLLLKKKKYAAVTLTKTKSGELKVCQEHKGLDIVRRDWSPLSAEAGKVILNHILSDQMYDEREENIQNHLTKLKKDLEENRVPLSLLVITKQLTKNPREYSDKNSLPHVQVALRYNSKGGKQLGAGDTVPYIICEDGKDVAATQRAYHIEEFKNSDSLKIDVKYYLSQQIHPVISRLCEPIEGIDACRIATWLGIDPSGYRKPRERCADADVQLSDTLRFRNCEPFEFKCRTCKASNTVTGPFVNGVPFLARCANNSCNVQPVEYVPFIQNQLTLLMRSYVQRYYSFQMICEDPACENDSNYIPLRFSGKYPVCTECEKGVMYLKYSAKDLHMQLTYFQSMFDLNKHAKKSYMDSLLEIGYNSLRETTERILKHSAFNIINLNEVFAPLMPHKDNEDASRNDLQEDEIYDPDIEDEDDI